jgi:hypothetical protein
MALQRALEANLTNVRYAVETSEGVLPVTPEWVLLEPNTEPRFGAELTTVERNPIDDDRMSDPGSIVDKNPGVQVEQDFTLDNQMVPLQAFMLAALNGLVQHRAITGIDDTNDEFDAASGLDVFISGDLVLGVGFGHPTFDALHVVAAASATALEVTTDLPALAVVPTGARLIRVGHQYASGDVTVDASGARPKLVTAAGDFRDQDLEVGCSIYVGGDATAEQFANATNNGEKRVFSVATDGSELEIDKSFGDMVTDATATGKTIRIFFGSSLKNKRPGDGFARTYLQLERTLGAPDDSQPAQIQSEYVTGATGSEYSLSIPAQDKVTSTMTFVGIGYETRSGSTGVKSGTRTDLIAADCINTSSDLKRLEIAALPTDETPTQLLGLIREMSLTLNNNVRRRTALGIVGAASIGVGELALSGSLEAYFTNISQLDAIGNYDKLTIHAFFAMASNQGLSFDMPLVTLRTDGAAVENNEDIMLSCDYMAHNGRRYHPSFDHALCWTFFPYLPTLARTVL